jgi:hypothetical protein
VQSAAAAGEYTQEQKSGDQWNASGFHEWIPSLDVEVRRFPVMAPLGIEHVHQGEEGSRTRSATKRSTAARSTPGL